MSKVLIYAGTTEGRILAKRLERAKLSCDVCVATEYGEQVMESSSYIHVLAGRLTIEEMQHLYEENDYIAVVDATHPFATVVTKNIKESLANHEIPLYRLTRDTAGVEQEGCIFFDTVKECAHALKDTQGNILLTTGSKDLAAFCEVEEVKKRLVVRVLPGMESLQLCYDSKLEGKQIIAMQGPFTQEMNLAQIHQYKIDCLVTKESGKIGGVDTKIEAARQAGIPCYVIRKPVEDDEQVGYSLQEVCNELAKLSGYEIDQTNEILVTLVGVGMGSKAMMTQEVQTQIEKAQYLFGAPRMLDGIHTEAKKYPYYLKEDILPCLDEIQKQSTGEISVAILFSGDTGFYSGCEKLYQALLEVPYIKAQVMPGISSIVAFSARIGISWQNATILSAHGVEASVWQAKLWDALAYEKKIFFLTSGPRDVQIIGKMLLEQNDDYSNRSLYLGYQISYPDERIEKIAPEDCAQVIKPGLYVGMIVQNQVSKRHVTPYLKDDTFVRDQVPMTKEEVRHISVCKLGLTKDSVVYDVGSGTGSIAVEMASLAQTIKVYAIETNETAVSLIQKNAHLHACHNLLVVHAMAPEGFGDLPAPTHAFIGGSKGNLREILDALYEKNPTMKIVTNAVSMETICEMQMLLKVYPVINTEITQVSISKAKALGQYHMMQANNPVFIFSFEFSAKRESV